MKVNLVFESEEERFQVLSMISLTLSKITTDLLEVEKVLVTHLEDTVKGVFVSGGLKKVALDNETSLKETANSFFKR